MDFIAVVRGAGSKPRWSAAFFAALLAALVMALAAFASTAKATNVAKGWGFNKQGQLGDGHRVIVAFVADQRCVPFAEQ